MLTPIHPQLPLWLEDDRLRMKITDNGMVRAPWAAGVGLSSMRERATALGGRLSAGPPLAAARSA